MKKKQVRFLMLIVVVILVGVAIYSFVARGVSQGSSGADEKVFRWSYRDDVETFDPHSLNSHFHVMFNEHIYETLTTYDRNMKVQPALATEWENTSPTTWRFTLRKGVKFHNGNDFTADDVIFSLNRAGHPDSGVPHLKKLMGEGRKIDDYTVEFTTQTPYPIFPRIAAVLMIMDKEWSEENGAASPVSLESGTGSGSGYTNQNANGTGPFILDSTEAGVKTELVFNENYWDKSITTNVTRAIFTPIDNAATQIAALISGEVDMAFPIPLQDWGRIDNTDGLNLIKGYDTRTLYIAMDLLRDELIYSNVKGANPFKDIRVRKAMAHSIDLDLLNEKVMEGAANPAGIMIAPEINGFDPAYNEPYQFDLEYAKELLTEAGYPDGFTIRIDGTKGAYVNDDRILQALAGMWTKLGLDVSVSIEPRSKYNARIFEKGGYDTSLYMIGLSPSTFDFHNILLNFVSTRTPGKYGHFNAGGYDDARVTELQVLAGMEMDPQKRQEFFSEALSILKEDYIFLPLHQQPLSWGVKEGITVVQRPDNTLKITEVILP